MYTLDIAEAVNNDGQSVSLAIKGKVTASELETLISELAAARASMLPPVSDNPPEPSDAGVEEHQIRVQEDADFSAALLPDGGIRLWLRNIGMGWLIFHLPAYKASALRGYLTRIPPRRPGQE